MELYTPTVSCHHFGMLVRPRPTHLKEFSTIPGYSALRWAGLAIMAAVLIASHGGQVSAARFHAHSTRVDAGAPFEMAARTGAMALCLDGNAVATKTVGAGKLWETLMRSVGATTGSARPTSKESLRIAGACDRK